MNIRMIPLTKLTPSAANVRKTGTNAGIDELAASIAAHGLLQNLQVRAAAGGKFEVVAGGRRLAALKLLAKRKSIAKSAEIACNVLEDEDAGEISLAENVVREPMHPADQFEAFKALADEGKGPEEIAARFGVTATVVRQRLKLASVCPRLIELYRAGEMTLDQLMAFAVSDDHAAQEAVWENLPEFNRGPAAIRRALTEAHVEADDPRAVFVGLDAYRAAGGEIARDLFQPEHEGYLIDGGLLDRLAGERLQREADSVRAEGWKWVEIMPVIDHAALRGFGRIEGEPLPFTPEQEAEIERVTAEYDSLIAEYGENPEPEIAERLDGLQSLFDAISDPEETWPSETKAGSGAILAIGHDGALRIERGLVRPEDRRREAAGEGGGEAAANGKAEGAPPSPLSAKLVEDLTAQRTAALRAALADNPTVALVAVVHALALPVFYGGYFEDGTCLDLRARSADLRGSAETIAEGRAFTRLAEWQANWAQELPKEPDHLWDWLLARDTATLMGLLAVASAFTVNAVRKPHDRDGEARLAHADRLATALRLDMAAWWQPTAASYFGRVPKTLALDAVKEAVSPEAADNLSTLRKAALAAQAEQRLAGRGWLPAILRTPALPEAMELAAE